MFPLRELYRVLKPDSYAISFTAGQASGFCRIWREMRLPPVGHFVWVKRYASWCAVSK